MTSVQVDVIMMHVRHATRGNITDANAHPFMFSNIVGAHNGTLDDKKYHDKDRTDSELMFRDMNERGIVPVINELHPNSAYAITVYDRNEGVVYFGRNDKRTLNLAFVDNRSVMYYASEMDMLKYLLHRAGVSASFVRINPDRLIKIKPSDINHNKKPIDCIKIAHRFKELSGDVKIEDSKETKEEPKDNQPPFETNIHSSTYLSNGWTQDHYVKSTEVVEKKEEKTAEIISFPPKNKDNNKVRSFYSKCACGAKTLNLLETNYSRRGIAGYPRYDATTDKHYCVACDPLSEITKKEISNVH